MTPMKLLTLNAFGLIVLTGFLIWQIGRPAGRASPPPSSECSCPFCIAASTGNPQEQGTFSEALPLVGNRAASKSSYSSDLAATEPAAADKVVATVNGEAIPESELMAGIPDDAFQAESDELKTSKLGRLVEEAVEWQFLQDRKVALSDEEFKKATADFETMIKTPGCPCCGGGFTSVEQFMQVKAFSPQELRRRITCDSGLKLYAARLATEQTSPQGLAEMVQKYRAEVEKDWVMAYMISFHANKEIIANDALARLKEGDSFETVARDMSEDRVSGRRGGALGFIRADDLGSQVQKVLGTLEPGKFSPVIKGAGGCCIVMRKKLPDEYILSLVRAKNFAEDQMHRELDAWRKRAKIQLLLAKRQE